MSSARHEFLITLITFITLSHTATIAAAAVALKRAELELLIDEPYFDRFVRNALVRVNVNTAESGRVVYRMAEVVGVDPEPHSRTYALCVCVCVCVCVFVFVFVFVLVFVFVFVCFFLVFS